MDKELVEKKINEMAGPLKILEAGCGRKWPLDLDVPHKLTGIDLDADALSARTDLDATGVGDLRSHVFPEHSFDVIYCCYVLEHVPGAAQVLENFARWVRPGGLIVIKVPDPESVFGWATRNTPHWFHVMFKRYFMGFKRAGQVGHGPYRTYYDRAITEGGIREFARSHNFALENVEKTGDYLTGRVVKYSAILLHYLSLRSLPWRHNNMSYVIRAQAA